MTDMLEQRLIQAARFAAVCDDPGVRTFDLLVGIDGVTIVRRDFPQIQGQKEFIATELIIWQQITTADQNILVATLSKMDSGPRTFRGKSS